MTEQRRPRKQLALFLIVSCVAHALILLCVPVGPNNETVGKKIVKEFKAQSIEFIKVIKPKPKPKPKPAVRKPKQTPRPRRRPRPVARRPQPRPEEPAPIEARVLPPPEPDPTPQEEPAPRPEPEPVEQPEPEPELIEIPKATPEPEEVVVTPPVEERPKPTIDTSDMVAMAPQPIPEGPKVDPVTMPGPKEPGRVIDSTEQPRSPSAPDIGRPEVTRPEPASGGDKKRAPQIGLRFGIEDRSALPGSERILGVDEKIAGPGGPVPVKVSPNPGGSSGGSPRMAKRPDRGPTGPLVRRGVRNGLPDAPGAPEGSVRAPGAPSGKRTPGTEGPLLGPTMGTGPGDVVSPGSGDAPGPAAPGNAIPVMTSPTSDMIASTPGANGFDAGGAGGGGGGDIVFHGGGLAALVSGGPGGPGGGDGGGGGSGAGKSVPRLGSPWGGDTGEGLYARGGPGGAGPGGPGGGTGGEGTGEGGGVGDGTGRGLGTGVGDGVGPGSGMGRPVLVAMAGPGGGYGQGDSPFPVGWPDGTATEGAPGFPWLEKGLGRAGGGGPGMFGGPHGRGSGGGYPGRGDKTGPGFGGIPGGTGIDIPPPHKAGGGGGGGGGDEPGGPGIYGPLTVGGGPGGGGGPGDWVALAKRATGIPVLPGGIMAPLAGIHGGGQGPGGRGTGLGAIGKGAPTGIYADLVGTYDIPVGVTNSDYNTDEVSVLNLLGVMRERTNVRVQISNRYVPLEYEAIKDQPMLWISGHQAFTWTPEEREALRKYVENGGTILAEDCHGPFNQVFPDEIRRVFGEELEPLPMDDELFRSFYVIDDVPAGDVQERYPIEGLRMADGRLGVIYSKNDYSDAWKVPRGNYVPDATKEQAFRMGINWYIYILAHWRSGQAAEAAAAP